MSPASSGLIGLFERLRRHLLKRAAFALALWVAVGAGGVLVLTWMLAGSAGWAQGTAGPLILDTVLVSLSAAAVALYALAPTRWVRDRRLADAVEDAASLASGTLLGSLELARSLPVGVSASLSERAQRRVLDQLEGSEADLSGCLDAQARRWFRNGLGGVAVMAPLIVLLVFVSPSRTAGAWGGLLRPFSLLPRPVLPALSVSPGSTEVLRGTPVAVQVRAPGREAVTLHWQAAGDIARSETRPIATDEVAEFAFAGVSVELEYWAEGPDGARSEVYTITPVDPLLVSDVRVSLSFPPHTGRFPEEYRGAVPPLEIPVGSRIRISGRASRPLVAASLVRVLENGNDGGPASTFQVDGVTFEADWTPRSGGLFRWSFRDGEDGPAEIAPEPLDLTLVGDDAPDIAVLLPGRDTVLPLSLRQPLVIEAGDDYGVDRIELVVYRVTGFGQRMDSVIQSLGLGGIRGTLARPLMDFSRWELLPGDTIRYLARAVDNAPIAQITETPEYVLRMPTSAELRREAQERLEGAADDLETLSERAARGAEAARDLERRTAGRPVEARIGFEERKEVEQAVERQEERVAEVDSLTAALEELGREIEEAGLSDAELRRSLEELQELLGEIASDELRERLGEFQQSLDDMDARRAKVALRELSEDQEKFRRQIEEALERFRRAAMEQDFRATTAEAEELAVQQRALAEALKEGGNPEFRAQQQKALNERAEDLQKRMQRLEERLAEAGEQDAEDSVQQAGDRTEQAQQRMSEAGDQALQGEPREAGESAERAAEELERVAEQLESAQADMAQRMLDAMRQVLEQTAGDALSLAREQSEVREQMRGASQETMASLRGGEAAILQGVRNMADNLAVMAQVAQSDSRGLSTQIGEAMEALRRTIDAMEGQRGRAPSPFSASQSAVDALNQVALLAMAGAQQAGQSGAGQATEQLMEQLEQLAQQQGSLNNQTGQLIPMQLGEQAMRQQLERISQGQGGVADELQDLSDQPGSEDRTLGDLEGLMEEARRLADALAEGRLTMETLRRQERLFHRLLDAGRSLEKDEESEERESEAPGAVERRDVEPLGPEELGALRFRLPPGEVLRRLSPAQRQMVMEYFERLNRSGRGRRSGRGNR
ncbi:MAG: hypothetical protein BMS9Abin29_1407 [Gemmatimonadota bacterium]|nr:MAG: hypothetical protein BMS9Abin29_1407 [Gemmatimonadota bacterium]